MCKNLIAEAFDILSNRRDAECAENFPFAHLILNLMFPENRLIGKAYSLPVRVMSESLSNRAQDPVLPSHF